MSATIDSVAFLQVLTVSSKLCSYNDSGFIIIVNDATMNGMNYRWAYIVFILTRHPKCWNSEEDKHYAKWEVVLMTDITTKHSQ